MQELYGEQPPPLNQELLRMQPCSFQQLHREQQPPASNPPAAQGTSAPNAPAGSAGCAASTASSSGQNAPAEEESPALDFGQAIEKMIWEIRSSLPVKPPSAQGNINVGPESPRQDTMNRAAAEEASSGTESCGNSSPEPEEPGIMVEQMKHYLGHTCVEGPPKYIRYGQDALERKAGAAAAVGQRGGEWRKCWRKKRERRGGGAEEEEQEEEQQEEQEEEQENHAVHTATTLSLQLPLAREHRPSNPNHRNHPEWQRDCGMRSPSDPLVLALEKDNKATKGKPKRCCSTCSINQRCTHPDKVYQAEALEQETEDILKPPPRRQERRRVVGDANSEPSLTPTSPTSSLASSSFGRTAIEVGVSPPTPKPWEPPKFYPPLPSSDSEWDEPEPLPPGPKIPSQGPIASRTRKQTREVIQAPLRQAITSDGETKLIKVPFSSIDLEIWERIAKGYQSDPIGVAKTMKFMIKQHSPDWADLQLLLDALTETEKQLVLKVAGDLAEDDCRTTQEDVKAVFPLQDPGWDPNDDEGLGRLKRYQELIVKGLERAIPKTINWSALYAIKQGPSQTPSEFLDHLRDAMRRHTTLDPGSDEGTQQLINLFLGQSTGDIRRKLQQIRGPNSWNLETLLDEAWRVFSNREEGYKQGMKKVVAVVKEGEKGRHGQGPPKQGPP
ncbi:hypothetical protein DUI87_34436 [Hirundo rustica rustica]|uniref:Core shell protein Gag P30 domain-containing protein n=1 Tax=Hirundo rustica rustica TaxID=333673 RepID=A0A3M0IK82_HIRRU|nr:hypothetical protein DUI87_34436 [Hirundo rustica rustica]